MLHSTASTPPAGRRLTAVVVITLALIVQVSMANRLPLPGSVAPDLVLLTVVALALVNGPLLGLVTGFCAGLTADIVPPADHTIGRYALVYCLVGYICGLFTDEMDRSPVTPFIGVAAGALAGTLLYVGVGMMLDDPRAGLPVASRLVPLMVLYDVLASPFVVWAVLRLTRRLEGERGHDRYDPATARFRAMARERM
ncbi:rod shape-determining protein MreD [Actinomadura sp. HBU206391]|uniref:rod shape-determining protein MreD n=1 Tax=Actinomadura sp. HBU206391 TaxID=2731692 RepID=UPI001650AA2C|nr:rod shape-determining protein MreD [Actinomadura sp. HBU206391]MBC6461567.1 rod shape-determining protein MreD [Actinomadura sp. HBU206391]